MYTADALFAQDGADALNLKSSALTFVHAKGSVMICNSQDLLLPCKGNRLLNKSRIWYYCCLLGPTELCACFWFELSTSEILAAIGSYQQGLI